MFAVRQHRAEKVLTLSYRPNLKLKQFASWRAVFLGVSTPHCFPILFWRFKRAPMSTLRSVVFRNFLPGNHLASSNPVASSERLRQRLGPRYAVVAAEIAITASTCRQLDSAEVDATDFTRKSPLVLAVWGPKRVTRFARY